VKRVRQDPRVEPDAIGDLSEPHVTSVDTAKLADAARGLPLEIDVNVQAWILGDVAHPAGHQRKDHVDELRSRPEQVRDL
jgi:hypothetical protein